MRALGVIVVVASVGVALVATMIAWLNSGTPRPLGMSLGSDVLNVAAPIVALAIVVPGMLIAMRLPRHPVGWCFLLFGLGAELLLVLENYGLYGTATAPGAVSGAGTALWIASWFWTIQVTPLTFAILLFPDGRPPSPRWRVVGWATVSAVALLSGSDAFIEPLIQPEIESPLGTPFAAVPLTALVTAGVLAWSLCMLAAGVSLVVRFRRAHGVERQQLKWVAFGASVAVVGVVLAGLLYLVPDIDPVLPALSGLTVMLIPLSAAVAILRYRLYDIDVVIERTLVYAMVSATLGVTYAVAVIVLQGVLRPITGGSDLAVALSTLLVVALFQPIRSRAQHAVDRRFFRARYDAAGTIDAFIQRLRHDVELDSVRADLLDVVNTTVHPAHASVWLRVRW